MAYKTLNQSSACLAFYYIGLFKIACKCCIFSDFSGLQLDVAFASTAFSLSFYVQLFLFSFRFASLREVFHKLPTTLHPLLFLVLTTTRQIYNYLLDVCIFSFTVSHVRVGTLCSLFSAEFLEH